MPPKQFELIEERTISGRGLFVVPPNDAYQHFYLYINVIRFPRNNWLNSKWNPDRSEYAKITWMRNDYVFREDVVNYPNQLFEHSPDPGSGGYIVQGMVCLFEEVTNYFDYIIPFIPAPPLAPGGVIPIEPLRNTPEQIKIVCRESTAIVAKLYALEYEEACTSATSTPKPPPDPVPEPEQPVPSPIGDISPPYEEPNDNGDSIPYPGDESTPPDPVIGEPCVAGTLTWQVKYIVSGELQTLIRNTGIFGQIDASVFFLNDPNPGEVSIFHQGSSFGACQPFAKRTIGSFGATADVQEATFISFE